MHIASFDVILLPASLRLDIYKLIKYKFVTLYFITENGVLKSILKSCHLKLIIESQLIAAYFKLKIL